MSFTFSAFRTNGGADVKVTGSHTEGKPVDVTIELGKRVPPSGGFGSFDPKIEKTFNAVEGGVTITHTFTSVPAEAVVARLEASTSPLTVLYQSILASEPTPLGP
jgi:hypothetical protein